LVSPASLFIPVDCFGRRVRSLTLAIPCLTAARGPRRQGRGWIGWLAGLSRVRCLLLLVTTCHGAHYWYRLVMLPVLGWICIAFPYSIRSEPVLAVGVYCLFHPVHSGCTTASGGTPDDNHPVAPACHPGGKVALPPVAFERAFVPSSRRKQWRAPCEKTSYERGREGRPSNGRRSAGDARTNEQTSAIGTTCDIRTYRPTEGQQATRREE